MDNGHYIKIRRHILQSFSYTEQLANFMYIVSIWLCTSWPVPNSSRLYQKWHFLQISIPKLDVPNASRTDLDVNLHTYSLFLVQGVMSESIDDQSGDSEKHDERTVSGARWLRHAEGGSIPHGAVRLNKQEISEILIRVVNGWKPQKEM